MAAIVARMARSYKDLARRSRAAREVRVMTRILCLLLLPLLLGACAPVATREASGGVTREQVLAGEPLFGPGTRPPLPEADILALDQPMRDFLARHVDRHASAPARLRQLVNAVIDPGSFGLHYSEATRTARETFATRDGNCLSFTTLFVALAREAGLKARFQQIDIPPDWEQRGELFVLNRHVNVLVDLGPDGRRSVDFNVADYRSGYDREPVSDRRAEAHYRSNLGAAQLQAGELRAAFLHLRRGLQADASFSPLWTNLGTVYLRAGALGHAEASYLEALRHDAADMVAASNLAGLYERRGDAALATHYRELAERHRDNNPYFRFQRARAAFVAGDYAAARGDLDFAIRRKPVEDTFYFLRALVRLRLGDADGARADLERAESVAADEALKRNYHAKMQLLPGQSGR